MRIIKTISSEEKGNDEMIIMNKDETSIVTLNSTATIVWNLIDKHHDFDAICLEMKSIFADVDEQEIVADVDETISQFVNAGIVVIDE